MELGGGGGKGRPDRCAAMPDDSRHGPDQGTGGRGRALPAPQALFSLRGHNWHQPLTLNLTSNTPGKQQKMGRDLGVRGGRGHPRPCLSHHPCKQPRTLSSLRGSALDSSRIISMMLSTCSATVAPPLSLLSCSATSACEEDGSKSSSAAASQRAPAYTLPLFSPTQGIRATVRARD